MYMALHWKGTNVRHTIDLDSLVDYDDHRSMDYGVFQVIAASMCCVS